jgi:hypothetical protein
MVPKTAIFARSKDRNDFACVMHRQEAIFIRSNGNGESGTLPPLEERIQAVPFQPVS